jgi:hypothetical protein
MIPRVPRIHDARNLIGLARQRGWVLSVQDDGSIAVETCGDEVPRGFMGILRSHAHVLGLLLALDAHRFLEQDEDRRIAMARGARKARDA